MLNVYLRHLLVSSPMAGKYHNWLVTKAARFDKCGKNL
jgi:hypothetical protein